MPVIDASAIINAKHAEGVTVPEVINELKDFESRELAQARIAEGKLSILSPSKSSVHAAKEKASPKLSSTDLRVLALALELKQELITDDYALQLSAKALGLKFKPVIFKKIH